MDEEKVEPVPQPSKTNEDEDEPENQSSSSEEESESEPGEDDSGLENFSPGWAGRGGWWFFVKFKDRLKPIKRNKTRERTNTLFLFLFLTI